MLQHRLLQMITVYCAVNFKNSLADLECFVDSLEFSFLNDGDYKYYTVEWVDYFVLLQVALSFFYMVNLLTDQ